MVLEHTSAASCPPPLAANENAHVGAGQAQKPSYAMHGLHLAPTHLVEAPVCPVVQRWLLQSAQACTVCSHWEGLQPLAQ